mgnify:CR=1 FL=1
MVSELTDSFDRDSFFEFIMAIDREQQISNQPGEYLCHQAILGARNDMINFQAAFPPGKKALDIPARFVDRGDIPGGTAL